MDTSLKQRLIGAVVLVALAVIFLPMLIKGPAPDSGVSDVSMRVPDEPAGEFVEIPLNTPAAAPEGGAVGLRAGVPSPADDAAPADKPVEKAATILPAAVAGGDHAVSFGAYATQADADAVVAKLKVAGLPGYAVADLVNGKPAWRVRIGPYADRAQAEIVRLEATKVRNDVNAQVVVLDADPMAEPRPVAAVQPAPKAPQQPQAGRTEPAKAVAAAPRPAEAPKAAQQPATPKKAEPVQPAAASIGFAVQLGAFASAADANSLRDKARAGGFSAFVEQVRTEKGVLNRVRVGPVASRADADKLKAQVAARLGVDGMVRPHP